jgi:hypothetical protein
MWMVLIICQIISLVRPTMGATSAWDWGLTNHLITSVIKLSKSALDMDGPLLKHYQKGPRWVGHVVRYFIASYMAKRISSKMQPKYDFCFKVYHSSYPM